jgi:hypothetical protein
MLIAWASAVPVQSVITLDDFKLDDDTKTAEAVAPRPPVAKLKPSFSTSQTVPMPSSG